MPLPPRLFAFGLFLTALSSALPFKASAQDAEPRFTALPLAFERNQGQISSPYQFLARRGSMQTFFLPDGLDIVVSAPNSSASQVRVRWADANPATTISGDRSLPGRSNYLRGPIPPVGYTMFPNLRKFATDIFTQALTFSFMAMGMCLNTIFFWNLAPIRLVFPYISTSPHISLVRAI